jgi:predicted SnoaL-like aldol condensation-catalyzing enzyme
LHTIARISYIKENVDMAVNKKEIVQRINEAFAENNLEKVLSFCTDDLKWTMVGDTTVTGKDPIRKWMASMDPQPPQLSIQQTIAEGDSVVARGDMVMQEKKGGPGIPYTFCDIYRFSGDKVAELTAFVVRTDKARASERTPGETKQLAGTRQG